MRLLKLGFKSDNIIKSKKTSKFIAKWSLLNDKQQWKPVKCKKNTAKENANVRKIKINKKR